MIVEKSSGITNSHIIGNALDRVLICQGDEKLWAGKYNEAEVFYLKCLNYLPYLSEPKLKLSFCDLYRGNAIDALSWIVQPIKTTLEYCQGLDPDPVEWACFIFCVLCQGKLDDAIKYAQQFPSLHHPELDRTRWVITILTNVDSRETTLNVDTAKRRFSIHQLPERNLNDWIDNLCMMLKACGQYHFVDTLTHAVVSQNKLLAAPKKSFNYKRWFSKLNHLFL